MLDTKTDKYFAEMLTFQRDGRRPTHVNIVVALLNVNIKNKVLHYSILGVREFLRKHGSPKVLKINLT